MMQQKLLFVLLAIVFPFAAIAQTATIKGVVEDEFNKPVSGATVSLKGTQFNTTTDTTGSFSISNVPYGNYTVETNAAGIVPYSKSVDVNALTFDMGKITTDFSHNAGSGGADNLPTVSLSDDDLKESSSQSASGVLHASRDAFESAATYSFSVSRFRIRGYDDENFLTLMNDAPMNDLINGRSMYNSWSGLNDVMRSRETTFGLSPASYSYGSIGGVYSIDSRASQQRKQLQASYSFSNRAYDNRVMITYGSGVMKGGWSVALSYSRRWADEGFIPGTFYDGHSYFASIEKNINSKHSLSLTAFGAPTKNGRSAPAVQEMYDLAGTHYYNPDWGYQNGKKRNAVVGDTHRPVAILTHEWNMNSRSSLETAVAYSFGKTKVSGLDWYNATDPHPEYYRNLPSFVLSNTGDLGMYQQAVNLYTNNENVRQINWDHLYEVNRNVSDTASYVLDNRVTDTKTFSFNTIYNKTISDHTVISAGATYQMQSSEYYKELSDLLGGKYFVNLNQFADQTVPGNAQNDLNNPNRHIVVGDKYGYDYSAHVSRASGWGQGVFKFSKTDLFAAVNVGSTSFYRTGEVRNGVYSDKSFGDSPRQSFFNYSFKGGITYKADGRNYLFVNGLIGTRAPLFQDAYVSPSTQSTLANDLQNEKVNSIEGGYLFKAPRFKARAVGYYTQYTDQTKTEHFFDDDFHTFVNYTLTGINTRHIGTELAVEASLGNGFTANAVAAMGQYFYTDRPKATITQDNVDTLLASNESVYATNMHVGGSPENAYTFGINYRSKHYWYLNINANYFDNIYIQFNPARRTLAGIDEVNANTALRDQVLSQQKVSGQFTLDISGGWSWKLNNKIKSLKRNTFFVINASVTNVLNNTSFITNGYEQLRFDFQEKDVNKFAPKYSYAFGTTFLLNLILRMN